MLERDFSDVLNQIRQMQAALDYALDCYEDKIYPPSRDWLTGQMTEYLADEYKIHIISEELYKILL